MNYNDNLILKNLLEKQTINETKFFHSKNEVGKYISKSSIQILNYLRNQIIMTDSSEDKFLLKEILFYSTELINLCLVNPDSYLVGLRRSLQKNLEINLMLINDEENASEKELLSFLDSTTIILEEKYELFHNFECKLSEIAHIIKIMIMDMFKKIQKAGFIMVSEEIEQSFPLITYINDENKNMVTKKQSLLRNISSLYHSGVASIFFDDLDKDITKEKKSSTNTPYEFTDEEIKSNSLMLKSNFIFSVVKFLKIMKSTNISNKEDIDPNDSLINSIFKLLYFFVEKNPDNCVIAIGSHMLNFLTNVENKDALKIFNFFHHCLIIIADNGFELTFTSTIVQVLGNYFFTFLVSLIFLTQNRN